MAVLKIPGLLGDVTGILSIKYIHIQHIHYRYIGIIQTQIACSHHKDCGLKWFTWFPQSRFWLHELIFPGIKTHVWLESLTPTIFSMARDHVSLENKKNMWYTSGAPDTFGSSPRHPRVPALIWTTWPSQPMGFWAKNHGEFTILSWDQWILTINNCVSTITNGKNKLSSKSKDLIWPSKVCIWPWERCIWPSKRVDLPSQVGIWPSKLFLWLAKFGIHPNEDFYNHWKLDLTSVWSSSIRSCTVIWRVYQQNIGKIINQYMN